MGKSKTYIMTNERPIYVMSTTSRHYGFFNFLFDVLMTCVTAGFWLIWVFVREMRNRRG